MSTEIITEDLRLTLERRARDIQKMAYAPYSKFRVGAALLGDDGSIHVGCNVENASYGATSCAERNAITAAVARGMTRPVAIAIATDTDDPATPCGICRQVLREFNANFLIDCYGRDGAHRRFTLQELLPASFGPESLHE